MSNASTIILAPYVLAFLLLIFRFYNREGASSITNPTFLIAIFTVALAFSFLGLGITGALAVWAIWVYGGIGLALLGFSIVRLFML